MLDMLERFGQKRQRRKALFDFLEELRDNLETYYVMDQRGNLEKFQLKNRKLLDEEFFRKTIFPYAKQIADFNKKVEDLEKYQFWYKADFANRNKDNARKLNGKKEELFGDLIGVGKVIQETKASFEKYLKVKGWTKG